MSIELTLLDYLVIVAYMVLVLLLGAKFSKDDHTASDFLLGGRNMPYIAVGISCIMSLLSTYSIVMVPGEIFNHGLSMWIFNLSYPILILPAFFLFTRFYFKLNSFTPFEYLEYRYDAKVRTLISCIYTYSRAIYLGMVLFSTSKVFEGGAGWPAWFTILLVGIIGTLYTVMGGMKAVIWTDVLQFFVLAGGITAAIVVMCYKIDGGFMGAITCAFENGRGLNNFSNPDFYKCNPYVRLSLYLLLLDKIMQPLTAAASDQITIQRLLSTKTWQHAFKAQLTSSIINIPFTLMLWFIGLATFTFYFQNPREGLTGDTAFFTFVSTELPAPIPGLIMAAMLAAVMSTLDSGINCLSTIWLKEIHLRHINKNLDDKAQVKISRRATLGFGVFSICIGLLVACSSNWLGQTVVESATIFHAFEVITFPAFLLAVLSKRANSFLIWLLAAILWGMKFGMLTWYVLSVRGGIDSSNAWAGPASFYWVSVPLGISALLFLFRFMMRKHGLITLAVALFPLGYALSTAIWYAASNYSSMPEPRVLSFQWVGFPVTIAMFLFAAIGLMLSKEQPPEKTQGLTLSTLNQDVRSKS